MRERERGRGPHLQGRHVHCSSTYAHVFLKSQAMDSRHFVLTSKPKFIKAWSCFRGAWAKHQIWGCAKDCKTKASTRSLAARSYSMFFPWPSNGPNLAYFAQAQHAARISPFWPRYCGSTQRGPPCHALSWLSTSNATPTRSFKCRFAVPCPMCHAGLAVKTDFASLASTKYASFWLLKAKELGNINLPERFHDPNNANCQSALQEWEASWVNIERTQKGIPGNSVLKSVNLLNNSL